MLATGMGARAVREQQKVMPVIGYLGGTSPGPVAASAVAAFHQGLSDTGSACARAKDAAVRVVAIPE